MCGIPENLIAAVNKKLVTGLTVVSNNAGTVQIIHDIIILCQQVVYHTVVYYGILPFQFI